MSGKAKIVSRKFATREFNTIGLVLILYGLCVLFLPMLLKNVLFAKDSVLSFSFGSFEMVSLLCLVIGTTVPFYFLKRYCEIRLRDLFKRSYTGLSEIIGNSIVLFAFVSAAIFVNMMVWERLGVAGDLISPIGISFDGEYITSFPYIFSFVIVTPLLEEYAFRGILLSSLGRYSKYFAIIASSLVYSFAHGSFTEMFPSFILGMMLSSFVLKYESLFPSIMVHIIFNMTLYFFLLVPDAYSMFVAIIFALLIIIALLLIVTKKYQRVIIRKPQTFVSTALTFLGAPGILSSLLLFVLHAILSLIFKGSL